MLSAVTSFGAPWSEPSRSAAVLRAAGSASGLNPAPATTADLAAAVVAAHALGSVLGVSTVAAVPRSGAGAAQALAAVLSRAGGARSLERPQGSVDVCAELAAHRARAAIAAETILELEGAACWVDQWLPGISGDALIAAAADLACGAQDPRLAAAADVLLALADERVDQHNRVG